MRLVVLLPSHNKFFRLEFKSLRANRRDHPYFIITEVDPPVLEGNIVRSLQRTRNKNRTSKEGRRGW